MKLHSSSNSTHLSRALPILMPRPISLLTSNGSLRFTSVLAQKAQVDHVIASNMMASDFEGLNINLSPIASNRMWSIVSTKAGDGIRTHGIRLGKPTFYH